MSSLWLFVFASFVAGVTTGASKVEIHPQNSVVVSGNSMNLSCGPISGNAEVEWNVKSSKTIFGENRVFDGKKASDGFSVYFSEHAMHKLVILSKNKTQPEDNGVYTCSFLDDGRLVHRSAELFVLASEPECGTNLSGNRSSAKAGSMVQMWCKLNSTTNVESTISWYRDKDQIFGDDEEDVELDNSTKIYKITIPLNALDNGKMFSCKFFFHSSDSNPSQQRNVFRASNAASYDCRWSFFANVLYGPRNITVMHLKSSYNYGDRLRCFAEGNPSPIYKWISLTTGEVLQGSNFTIDSDLSSGETHLYQCIATNWIFQTNHFETKNVTISISSGSHSFIQATALAIFLPIVGSLLLLNIGLVLQKRFIRAKTVDSKTDGGNLEPAYNDADESLSPSEMNISTMDGTQTASGFEGKVLREMNGSNTLLYSNLKNDRPLLAPTVYSHLETFPSENSETQEMSSSSDIYVNAGENM